MKRNRLTEYKHIHCIGIKGAGMAALAELLHQGGVTVSGSDTSEIFFTDTILKKLGIKVYEGFSPENIPKEADLIVYSTAYSAEKNEELAWACAQMKVLVMSYPEALGSLTEEKMTIAVCGSHGKTTTSALLADTLQYLGHDPSAIVGSHIIGWQGSALFGRGDYLVIEADEYQNKLALYTPFAVIITSVDWDHPDYFPDPESYEQVFTEFVKRIPAHGILVYCADSSAVVRVAKHARCRTVSYGTLKGALFRVTDYTPFKPAFVVLRESVSQSFAVEHEEEKLGPFHLKLAGLHNALNTTAVLALLMSLRLDTTRLPSALLRFSGTERRFEYIGEHFGALIYDDYAHHPEEIRATLQAFRDLYPDKCLRVIFHPHTFSRTKALLTSFAQSFDRADKVQILDIYGSAREEQGGVSSQNLVDLINTFFPGKAEYVKDVASVIADLKKTMGHQDVIITLGAGSVWEIAHALVREKK